VNRRFPAILRLALAGLVPLPFSGCGADGDGEGAPRAADTAAEEAAASAPHNTLTPQEAADGWILLFDGVSNDGWRGYGMDRFPEAGWAIEGGNLVVYASDGSEEGLGGDIISEAEFDDFELVFDVQISPVGNSGVFYRVAEMEGKAMWEMAPEFQVLDDTAYLEMGTMDMETHLTGDNYDLHASRVAASRPLGEWNTARIVADGNRIEHWLNGELTVSYELHSDDWEARVADSKFDPGIYARAPRGHIGIQDHGHEIRYRNIKIRPLNQDGIALFNGRNLDGWTVHGTEVWFVDGGDLVCESGPDAQYGYLATEGEYRDFDLTLEFKQEADGNSGVFFRSHVQGTVISGWQAEVAPPGLWTGGIYESYGRGWLVQPRPEKDAALRMGEWNHMRIRAEGPTVTTWVNGERMASLTDDEIGRAAGHIALQIHDGGGIRVRWRNIRVVEL